MGLGYTYSVGFKVRRDHPLADDVFESEGTEYSIRLHSVALPDGDVLLTIFSGDSGWQFSEPIVRQEHARKWDGHSPLLVYRQFYQTLDFDIPPPPIEFIGQTTLEELVALRGNLPWNFGKRQR